jgi:hypothetical protein
MFLLANTATDTKILMMLTEEARGDDRRVLSKVEAFLENNLGAMTSQMRQTHF